MLELKSPAHAGLFFCLSLVRKAGSSTLAPAVALRSIAEQETGLYEMTNFEPRLRVFPLR